MDRTHLVLPVREPVQRCRVEFTTQGGGRPVLHLVHPAGGSVLCYRRLAAALAPEVAVAAFQSPGLTGGEPLADVRSAADRYLSELPAGRVVVGGWSSGGIIAFEMARCLAAAGHRVGPVVLVDTSPPGGPIPADHELTAGFDRDVDRLVRDTTAMSTEERSTRLRMFRSHVRAVAGYRPPGPFPGDVLLLTGRDTPAGTEWRPPVTGRVTVRRLPADHYELMEPPHVIAVASFLKGHLGVHGEVCDGPTAQR